MQAYLRRRAFITLLGSAVMLWPVGARTRSRAVPLIGVLWHAGSAEEEGIYVEALSRGLADFGYVEGKNITLEHRFPAEIPERFESLAAELVALDVDILVAINLMDALAAQRATKTIPIVFVYVADPVASKLVASLAHPGGNITGLSNFAPDLVEKRVEYLKKLSPGLSRVALLVNPNAQAMTRRYIEEAKAAADKLRLVVRPVEIRTADELAVAFSAMQNDQINGVIVTQDGLFYAKRKEIADLALTNRLPAIVYSRETVEVGALASYGPNNYSIFRRAGAYIDKILKGASPAALPVEQPAKFEFIINLKPARALGLDVAPSLLALADEVID
jgi:putative ABC transport system substrate-binding protein